MTANRVQAAILLAGGQSRRMGRDKAALPLGDMPLAARIHARLERVFQEVVVVTHAPETFPVLNARMVGDRHPGRGPLEGLAAGLSVVRHDRALLIACDMPFVEVPFLEYLATQPGDAVVPLGPTGPEPLLAVYAVHLLSRLEAFLDAGGRSARAFLATLEPRLLPEPEWRPADPTGRALWNLNRPEDYARARAAWEEAPPVP